MVARGNLTTSCTVYTVTGSRENRTIDVKSRKAANHLSTIIFGLNAELSLELHTATGMSAQADTIMRYKPFSQSFVT
jgi:hypothetical protein